MYCLLKESERKGQEKRIRSTKRGAINRAENVIENRTRIQGFHFQIYGKSVFVFFFGEIKMNDVVKNHKKFEGFVVM